MRPQLACPLFTMRLAGVDPKELRRIVTFASFGCGVFVAVCFVFAHM